MPYIEAKLSIELNDNQKDELQAKLAQAVSSAFSKPNAYIMTNIEDEKSLYMGGKKVEKGEIIAGIGKGFGFESKEKPHIHLEILKNGECVNPIELIK